MDAALVILAAGRSRRFGKSDKLLADFAGAPLALRVADNLSAIKFAARFAVIAKGDIKKAKLFRARGFTLVENKYEDKSARINKDAELGASRRFGLSSVLQAGLSHACLCLADMPFVGPKHIHKLMEYGQTADAVFSVYQDRKTPPVLFGPKAIHANLSAALDARPTELDLGLVKNAALSARAALDIDRPEDLKAALKLLGGASGAS